MQQYLHLFAMQLLTYDVLTERAKTGNITTRYALLKNDIQCKKQKQCKQDVQSFGNNAECSYGIP